MRAAKSLKNGSPRRTPLSVDIMLLTIFLIIQY
jgi:hypothetical protein